jgi:FAD/FMN-containing dehydrogenase
MSDLATGLTQLIADSSRVLTQPQIVERLSRDFYWYSPILKAQLDDKRADIVVQPISIDEIIATLRYCNAHNVPVTVRGAGTGNYGQSVPLKGGVMLDLQLMDRIETIEVPTDGSDAVAVCEPGVKLGALETAARELGWELRCYPSTVAKSSLGGFLGGGSGGIGSVSHGGLRDFQTVRAIEVVTMESEPRIVKHEGDAVHEIMHSWGTNGIITRIWLALTPAVEWGQLAVTFPTFDAAFAFGEVIATNPTWQKRLITTFEWPLPSFFGPIKHLAVMGHSSIFFMIAEAQRPALEKAVLAAGGAIQLSAAWKGLRSQPLLSDYTWNHTTLWAMKANPEYTYLQCGYDPERVHQQLAALKARYGDSYLHHMEWNKSGTGVITPGAIPVVKFTTPEALNEMIDFCRSIGVGVANPHINNVEGGGRYRQDNVQLQAKYKNDPKGLLNPGKMPSFVPLLAAKEAKEEVSA